MHKGIVSSTNNMALQQQQQQPNDGPFNASSRLQNYRLSKNK